MVLPGQHGVAIREDKKEGITDEDRSLFDIVRRHKKGGERTEG